MIAKRFDQLRAWEAATTFKRAIYALCRSGPVATDFELRDQLRKGAASAPANIAEGFGRFNPPDFARFAVIAKASLVECQNHLIDAVHRGHIDEATRTDLNALAVTAIQETNGLIEYLQSPEALRNARCIRERRLGRERNKNTNPEHGNMEP